ncbi:alanine racemase [Paenibacillus sp. GCM10027626]|uniref:alanine racemase n=1 Tax=Paenibacillus sp. GCM10027626 TaxID=3273411 RepID=UPI00362C56C3
MGERIPNYKRAGRIDAIQRETYAEVDLAAIRHNARYIRQLLPAGTSFMAVVKADGYGHGGVAVAREALRAGADQLAVAYLSEALELRNCGITAPILILTPIAPAEVPLAVKRNLMLTVASAAWLQQMRAYKPVASAVKLKLHLKLDTGLGRAGIRERWEWEQMLPLLREADIAIEGVYTHFATAGQEDTSYMEQQRDRFMEMAGWVKSSGLAVRRYHSAGSAAALRFPELAMDMVRIGAALYGFTPRLLRERNLLKPALQLHSRLIQVKQVRKGEYIGYDQCYQAEQTEWVGTVPIGYADGWNQSLRLTEVLVDGQRAPIIGKICMDQMMIRLPKHYLPGTRVTLIGRQGQEQVTCAELAQCLGGAAQEITSSLAARVPRIY